MQQICNQFYTFVFFFFGTIQKLLVFRKYLNTGFYSKKLSFYATVAQFYGIGTETSVAFWFQFLGIFHVI